MDISPAHAAAVLEAIRVPALEARLALLNQDDPESTLRASIDMYATTRPVAGEAPGGAAVVSIKLASTAGTVDGRIYQLSLSVPVEGQVSGADPTEGSIPLWARIYGPDDSWWADASVSVAGSGGEIQMAPTGQEGDPLEDVARLYNGAFARLTSAVFQG